MLRLEVQIEDMLDRADDGGVFAGGQENMDRLLGAHRGVFEALVYFAKQADAIDWAFLREAVSESRVQQTNQLQIRKNSARLATIVSEYFASDGT